MACLIALTGVAIMSLDGRDGDVSVASFLSSLSTLSQGDLLIILAAFSYTFHCLRLEGFAKQTTAIQLGAAKATTETGLSLALVLGLMAVGSNASEIDHDGLLVFAAESGREISQYLSTFADTLSSAPPTSLYPAVGAIIWTGLITCGYTITAQSYGQSRVDPITANLIYTIQPIFTAVFAWALLGETLGPAGYIGGGLIGCAVYLVAADTG
jgi:drug/metabolite transporter (DMT)-like permease